MANKATDCSRKNRKAALGAALREEARREIALERPTAESEREALEAYWAKHPEREAEARAAMIRMVAMLRGGK